MNVFTLFTAVLLAWAPPVEQAEPRVTLQINRAEFLVRDPLFLRVSIRGDESNSLPRTLGSRYGSVQFFLSRDGRSWEAADTNEQDAACVIGDGTLALDAGEQYSLHEFLLWHKGRYFLDRPGKYFVRAVILERFESAPVEFNVSVRPQGELRLIDRHLVRDGRPAHGHPLSRSKLTKTDFDSVGLLVDGLSEPSGWRDFLTNDLRLQRAFQSEGDQRLAHVDTALRAIAKDVPQLTDLFALRAAYRLRREGDLDGVRTLLARLPDRGDLRDRLLPEDKPDPTKKDLPREFAY